MSLDESIFLIYFTSNATLIRSITIHYSAINRPNVSRQALPLSPLSQAVYYITYLSGKVFEVPVVFDPAVTDAGGPLGTIDPRPLRAEIPGQRHRAAPQGAADTGQVRSGQVWTLVEKMWGM